MRITGPSGQPQIPQQADVYTAQQGETLSSIASKRGVSESDLASSNNLAPGAQLKLGQQLNVPQTQQKSTIQHGIASMRDSFETSNKHLGPDMFSKGIIVQNEGDAKGIWVQSEGSNASLDAAKLAEDIRFKSQFQPPQAALGRPKTADQMYKQFPGTKMDGGPLVGTKPKTPFDKSAEVHVKQDGPIVVRPRVETDEKAEFFDATEQLKNQAENIAGAAINTKKTESEG